MFAIINQRNGLVWPCAQCSEPLRYDVNGPSNKLPVVAWMADAYGSLHRVPVAALHQRCVAGYMDKHTHFDPRVGAAVPPLTTIQTLPYFLIGLLRTMGYTTADLDYCETLMGQQAADVKQSILDTGMAAIHLGGWTGGPTEDDLREEYEAQQAAAQFRQEQEGKAPNITEENLDDIPF